MMMNQTTEKTLDDLVYLISNSLCNKRPESSRVQSMDLDEIYELASFHSIIALVAFSLETVIPLPDKFDQAKKKAIRKLVLFDVERNKILQRMSEEKIWHMPLKGSVLKGYYPKYGMREMSDNDILCDSKRLNDVKCIMEQLGFSCEKFEERVDDTYTNGLLAFEIHRFLFDEHENRHFHDYYKDIKQRLIPIEQNPFEYKFSPEDFYIYMIAHEYKHFIYGGTGLRSLVDTFVYLSKWHDSMDWNYIFGELEKLQIKEFEEQHRQLSIAILTGKQLNQNEQDILLYYVSSGTHGVLEHIESNHLSRRLSGDDSKQSKRKYLVHRLFISGEDLKNAYPFFYKHKSLIPFLQLFRLFMAVFIKPKMIIGEYKSITRFKY